MSRYIKEILKDKTKYLILNFIFMTISALDGVISPFFIGQITNFINERKFDRLYGSLLMWGFSVTFVIIALLMDNYYFGKIVEKTNIDLKTNIFENSYSFEGKQNHTTDFTTTILSDTKEIENNFLLSIKGIIYSILQSIITLSFLVYINWKVGLIFVVLGFIPTFVPSLTSKWLQNSTKDWQWSNRKYVKVLEDGLEGRSLIVRYQIKEYIFNHVKSFLKNLENKYLFMRIKQSISSKLINILYIWSIVFGFIICVDLVKKGQVNAGILLTAYMASDRVTTPLISIAHYYNQMLTTKPILENVLHEQPMNNNQKLNLIQTNNLIEIEDLSIIRNKHILFDNFNLNIEKGDKILIKGASGSGKSTLLKVILNEFIPQKGRISYNNTIFNNGIYNQVAIIDQNPFIFNDTLLFNLIWDKNISEEKIIDVLKKVGLGSLANHTDLHTEIGDGGRTLSNGEIKRLELARAILHQKNILLVDEVLSGLDLKRAEQINQVIFTYFDTIIDVEHHITPKDSLKYNKIINL
ncbi:ABC transporter ATP-binding protein/permease [Ignavigranum ruoffiae]|uniref:ATP-binding cassette domain-containing protein n=1 Tax=Ignavigranum ruoffiae TaxID=89093 RepID=UPI002063118D|nr:ABC transporter ATP-binding protein [Ignavigranum ruoffiae]UPQ85521.1 ABC transporter ATP-binding protein/permease [Ignavigranum ruoffiae]